MKRVAVLSNKGGVGKSTLCHLLAVGCVWRGVPAYLFHTDHREPMKVDGRPYEYIDGRDEGVLSTVVNSLSTSSGFAIIDGGGNRPEFNEWISKFVDLVLIPVTADEEAINLGRDMMADLEGRGITTARYVMNMTSSNQNARQFDFQHFFGNLEPEKIAGEVRKVEAVKRLRLSDKTPFETPPSNVNNLSRSVYRMVIDTLENMNGEEILEDEAFLEIG